MKKTTLFHLSTKSIITAWCLLLVLATAAGAAPSKLLINIIEKNRNESSPDISPVNASQAEILLAKYLIKSKYDVMTSDDLSVLSQLTTKDLSTARGGNIPALRKVAAINDAAVIFSGTITSQTSQEEVLGMQMSKAVTTISFRILDTASGDIIEIDNQSYKSTSRSPEEANQTGLEQLAVGVSRTIVAKVPAGMANTTAGNLAKYKKSFAKPVQVAQKTTAQGTPAVTPAGATPVQAAAPITTASGVPQIVITNPAVGRGFQTVEKKQTVNLEGLAIDSSGIKSVKVNGNLATLDPEGRFTYRTELTAGDNRLFIVAMNNNGITATKDLVFSHPEDETPPEIVITHPSVNRGFAVVAPKPGVKTLVAGLVKDDSDLMFLRVNDQPVDVSPEGNFSKEIDIAPGQAAIVISAMDKLGNQVRKEFQIARNQEGTRSGQVAFEAIASQTGMKPALWGLVMGVSRYESTAVDLKYADKDALSLAEFIKTQSGKLYSEVHMKVLVNEQVTRDSVIQAISSHLGKAAPDDVAFIFLAGHGIKHRQSGSYYFVPYDADYNSILSKGMRMSDFEESINILSKNVKKIVVALDTCHSGAMEVGMRGGGTSENLADALRDASGRYILAASKGGEESLEDDKFKLAGDTSGHGAFTYALINGMSGEANYDKDDYISLNELFQYVAKQVPRLTEGRQHPYFRTEGTDLPFVLTK